MNMTEHACVHACTCVHTHTLNNSKAQALGTQNCVRHSPHSQEQPASLERHSGLIFLSAPLFYMKSFPQALYPESGNHLLLLSHEKQLFLCESSILRWQQFSLQALSFPGGASGKEPACQCKGHERRGSDLWVMSDSLQPHGLSPSRSLSPWNFPSKNTGVGSHFFLQGIFRTQG